ncbi:hypothetical protein [Streptomyces canus]|uniref:hypothetical protein n=1 Tax=Streptomyces canus TaxID=58343 RepID=UPI00277E36E3|nr:hypothetical protein [Streptomyces canus]MDQ1064707.1 hypothetical protein [Streptomyces canus]
MVSGAGRRQRMWFRRKRDKKRQFTSISVSLTGATLSWQAQETEHARARQILHHLEDHRMLYDPYEAESFEAVVQSADRLRSYLSEQIPQCESVGLRDGLREIQAALRAFLTRMPRQEPRDYGPFYAASEAMRARVGAAAGAIADAFGIPVNGDLARIVQQGRTDT